MEDHQLFYGAKFEGNPRGKNFCLYNLPLFVIHLCLCTPTFPMPFCQLFNPGTTWPGADTSYLIKSVVASLMTSHSQGLRSRSLTEQCVSDDTHLQGCHGKNLAKTAMPNKLFVITKAFFCIFLSFLYLGFSSYTRELYYVCYIMLA